MITVFEETSKAVLGWFISYFKGIYNIRSHTPEYFTHLKIFDNYGIDNGWRSRYWYCFTSFPSFKKSIQSFCITESNQYDPLQCVWDDIVKYTHSIESNIQNPLMNPTTKGAMKSSVSWQPCKGRKRRYETTSIIKHKVFEMGILHPQKVFFLFPPWLEVLDLMHLDSIKLHSDWVAKCWSLCSSAPQKLFNLFIIALIGKRPGVESESTRQ